MSVRHVLMVEGGGMRGAFTCGVLNALQKLDISFDEVVALSSGAVCSLFFLSGQYDKLRTLFPRLIDIGAFGLRSFFKGEGFFGLPSLMKHPVFHEEFDRAAFLNNATEFYVGLTRVRDAAPVFYEKKTFAFDDDWLKVIQASASLPMIGKTVFYRGEAYVDGGIYESLPLSRYTDEEVKILVVHTQPRDYVKRPQHLGLYSHLWLRGKPALKEAIRTRHLRYNEGLEMLSDWERKGRAFMLLPSSHVVQRYSKKQSAIASAYIQGYATTLFHKDFIRAFFEEGQ